MRAFLQRMALALLAKHLYSTPSPMAPDNYNQVEYLLEMIREAFRGVTLGDGVSIRQTEVIDAYGSDEEQAAARAKDKTTDWPSLVDDPVFYEV